jgi:hypothetical protein
LLDFLKEQPRELLEVAVGKHGNTWVIDRSKAKKVLDKAGTGKYACYPKAVSLPRILALVPPLDNGSSGSTTSVVKICVSSHDPVILDCAGSALPRVADGFFELQQVAFQHPDRFIKMMDGYNPVAPLGCETWPAAADAFDQQQRLMGCGTCGAARGGDAWKGPNGICSGCYCVAYCSEACQKQDWKGAAAGVGGHRRICRLLLTTRTTVLGAVAARQQLVGALGASVAYERVPDAHALTQLARLPLLSGASLPISLLGGSMLSSGVGIPLFMTEAVIEAALDEDTRKVVWRHKEGAGFTTLLDGVPEQLVDEINLLRSFTPTNEVMETYGMVDQSGRFRPQKVDMGWDIADMRAGSMGAKYKADLQRLATFHGVDFDDDVCRIAHQLRLKRARGFMHILAQTRPPGVAHPMFAWMTLDEVLLHGRLAVGLGPPRIEELAERYKERYGGLLPGAQGLLKFGSTPLYGQQGR